MESSPLSASQITVLLKARDDAQRVLTQHRPLAASMLRHAAIAERDFAKVARIWEDLQRTLAQVRPFLREFDKVRSALAPIQIRIEELNVASHLVLEADAAPFAEWPLPPVPPPAPSVGVLEKAALEDERDAWRSAYYDLFLTLAFDGPENAVGQGRFSKN